MRFRWFVSSAFFTLMSLVIIRGFGLVRSSLVARFLGPEEFGKYSIVISLLYTLLVFASFGLPVASAKLISEENDPERKNAITTGIILITSMMSLMIGIGVYFSSRYIAVGIYNEITLIQPVAIIGFVIMLQTVFRVLLSIPRGEQNIFKYSLLDTLDGAASAILVCSFALLFGLSGAFYGWIIASFLSIAVAVLTIFVFNKKSRFRIRWPNGKTISRIFSISIGAFLTGVLIVPVYWYGDTILKINSGFIEVGWMAIAKSLGTLILFVPTAVSIPLLPLVAEGHSSDRTGDFTQIFRLSWITTLSVATIMGAASRWLVPLIYGKEYNSIYPYVYFYLLATFFISLSGITGTYLIGINKVWQGFLLQLIWATLFVGIGFFSVRVYGISGLVTTYLVSYSLFVGYTLIYLRARALIRKLITIRLISSSILLISISFVLIFFTAGWLYWTGLILLSLVACLAIIFMTPEKIRQKVIAYITLKKVFAT